MSSASIRLLGSVLLCGIACGSVGCGTRVEYMATNTPPHALAPRAADSVEVYTVSKPDRSFVEVAILEARQASTFSVDAPPDVVAELREQAGEHGCDAIVMTGAADEVVGATSRGTGGVQTLKGYRATCIVFR